MFQELVPKSWECWKSGYSFSSFKQDLVSGITVGVISLPLAMAFAIASGVDPARGLFTAIIGGFLISCLGGSRVQIGGPTGAFVVLIYSIMQRTGYEGLCLSTLIASLLLVLSGLFRLGTLVRYIPHSLIVGFTSGIAVLIFSSQVGDFFGMKTEGLPVSFLGKWSAYFAVFPGVDWNSFTVASGSLGLIFFLRRYYPSLPWGMIAIVFATSVVSFLDIPIATIQSRFGMIPSSIPSPHLPSFSFSAHPMKEIVFDAIGIALLGGIESLLSAVIGDRLSGCRHKPNSELVAQGIGNFGSILFGGIPATGAIARTAVNVQAGAKSPLSGIIHAITLLFILLFFAPIVSFVPLAALSAVVITVAWNMSEIASFIAILKTPNLDRAILLSSFLLTIFTDLTTAICVGLAISCFGWLKNKLKNPESSSAEREE